MKTSFRILGLAAVLFILAVFFTLGFKPAPSEESFTMNSEMIKRGMILVEAGGCHDCHSPKVFVPMGPMMIPVPDTSRLLSGHPAGTKLPAYPAEFVAPDKWGGVFTNDLTGWAGPWGASFARNLTPDVATGLGSWTPEMFIKTLRTGKHMGEGRDLLPPMPWQGIGKLSDDELKAIFAYLRSLKPIENPVPDPIPPSELMGSKK